MSLLPGVRMNVGTQTLCKTQDIPRPSQGHHLGGGRFRSNPRPGVQVQHGQMHGATTSSRMGSPDAIVCSPPGVHRGHKSAATLLQRFGENDPAKTAGLRSLSLVSIPRALHRFLVQFDAQDFQSTTSTTRRGLDADIGCCSMDCLLCSTLPPTLTAGRTGQALIEPHIIRWALLFGREDSTQGASRKFSLSSFRPWRRVSPHHRFQSSKCPSAVAIFHAK
jgi:hypothetical protein